MIETGPTGLTDARLFDAWEAGYRRTPIDRAAVLFEAGRAWMDESRPERDEVDGLTLGMLDAGLLACREATFGSRIEALAQCPACDEALEFGFDVDDVRTASGSPDDRFEVASADGDYRVTARLPTLADLRVAAGAHGLAGARRILDERCVVEAIHAGDAIGVGALPDEVTDEVGRIMAAADRQADVRLALTCPACHHEWETRFEIATFLWQEIDARARRLLVEVHTLAEAYGWPEADIIAMPAERRGAYLELVLG